MVRENCKKVLSWCSPLPKDKILDWLKMKAFANNKPMVECNTILSAYTKYRHLG